MVNEDVENETEDPGREKEGGGSGLKVTDMGLCANAADNEEVKRSVAENWLLTTCSLLAAGSTLLLPEEELLVAPSVPEGLLLNATYPNSPAEEDPHFSNGNPGQASSQDPVDTVSAGT